MKRLFTIFLKDYDPDQMQHDSLIENREESPPLSEPALSSDSDDHQSDGQMA